LRPPANSLSTWHAMSTTSVGGPPVIAAAGQGWLGDLYGRNRAD